MEPDVHQALRHAARDADVSLNEYCVSKVRDAGPAAAGLGSALAAWALDAFGEALVGVAIYGSWARSEATAESDVDLLVVLAPSEPLRRDLYRRADGADLEWDGHPVQVQLVQLPAGREGGEGLWPEISLDGIVLFERGFCLSRLLVAVRRAIAGGRLIRRTAQGQPYWTTADEG